MLLLCISIVTIMNIVRRIVMFSIGMFIFVLVGSSFGASTASTPFEPTGGQVGPGPRGLNHSNSR